MDSTSHNITKHPFILLASSYVLLATALIYTPPKTQPRLGALAVIAAHTILVFLHVDASQIRCSIVYIYGCTQIGILLYASYLLYLAPECLPPTATTFARKARWAAWLLTNPRCVGTSRAATPTQRSSRRAVFLTRSSDATTRIPLSCRAEFLLTRVLTCVVCGALSAASARFDESFYWPALRDGDYGPEKERFFRRLLDVDVQDFAIRLYLPLQYFLPAYCTLAGCHAGLSVIAVLCGQDPAVWPLLFGSLADVYSLRRFWGYFWQGFHRVTFVALADFVTHDLLRLPRGSRLNRGLVTLLVFAISGWMHSLCIKLQSRNCEAGPVIYWFCLAGAGVVIEDCAQTAWVALEGYLWRETKIPMMKIRRRIVGCIWVWAFFAWSLPKMLYPTFACTLID